MTTHEAKEAVRRADAAGSAHQLHVLLVQIAEANLGLDGAGLAPARAPLD